MKKNHVFLALSAAAVLVIAGAGCSKSSKTAYYLGRANRWFTAGQYDKAEIEYLNVLRRDPENALAIGRLGDIYFDEGRFQKAAPYLYKGSQLAANDLDLRLKLTQIYLAVGMLKDARAQAEFVLDKNPQDLEAPVFLAESVSASADINAVRGRLLDLSKKSDDAALETGLGILAARQHDFQSALGHFQRALALDSRFAPAYASLAGTYWQQDDVPKAEAAFKAAADCAPPRSSLQLQYGQFEIEAAHFDTAENFFQNLTRQTPDYVPGWLGLAEVALDEKKLDDCAAALKKAFALDSDNVDAQILDARLDLARADTAKAAGKLERLAKLYPQAPRIHYQLGLAYVVAGQTGKALNQLHEAVDLDPGFVNASFLLAQLEIKTGDTDSALDLLKPLVAQQPQFVEARLLVADAYRIKGDFNDALHIYQQLEKEFPKNSQIPLLTGMTFAQQLNEAAARQEFNHVLALAPENVSAQEELAQLDLADGHYASAQDRVERVIVKEPQQAFPEILLAKIFLVQGQTNQAEMALVKASGLPNGSGANLLLARLYYNAGQDQKALNVLNTALANDPKDMAALMLDGIVLSDQKNYSAAADAYEKLLAINPQASPALNNLAWLYADDLGNLDKAYDLAQRARQLLPNDPSAADTLGWVDFKKGDYQTALRLFQESADHLSDNPEVQFHVGIAHYMLADEDAARDAFQRALNSNKPFPERSECRTCLDILNVDPKTADASATAMLEKRMTQRPDDPIAFSRLAAIYQRDHQTDKAIALCETALKANPQNANADVLLAQLFAVKDPQRAFALAKAAYQLKPDDAEVCATLGRMAFLNGNDQWAYSLLEKASQSQPNNAQTFFDLANAAFSVGKMSEAQTAMQTASQDGLPPSQTGPANNFLHLIALAQNPEQAVAAQSHVDAILNSDPDNAPALFADAVIQTQNNNPAGAEGDYEKLLDRHPDCTLAQKNLAILYAQNLVDPVKAYPVALKAREAFPDDPQVAKSLALVLFERGDYEGAANLFNSLSDSSIADAQVFYCLGISEYRLKNFVQSRKSLQHALALNLTGPQATDARQTLAELSN